MDVAGKIYKTVFENNYKSINTDSTIQYEIHSFYAQYDGLIKFSLQETGKATQTYELVYADVKRKKFK